MATGSHLIIPGKGAKCLQVLRDGLTKQHGMPTPMPQVITRAVTGPEGVQITVNEDQIITVELEQEQVDAMVASAPGAAESECKAFYAGIPPKIVINRGLGT